MPGNRALHGAALTVLLLAATTAAGQDTLSAGDARFEETHTVEGQELTAAGAGTASYRIVFTVYGAAFYVPAATPRSAVLAAGTPRHLEIEYFYEIAAQDITKAGNTVLKRQLTEEQFAAIEERLKRFQDWFQQVQPGDRYTMTYVPDQGTTLRFNGEKVGTVKGADFARAYFGIWLGKQQPLSESLREDLLARLE